MTSKFFSFRNSLFSIFFFLFSFHLYGLERTFDEIGMRAELAKEANFDSYYSITFPRLDLDNVPFYWTGEHEEKSARLLQSVRKNIRLNKKINILELEAIVAFVEKAKTLLDFKTYNSRYFHAGSDVPFNLIMYKSGRTYILFEDFDMNSQSGGFKVFTHSLEYNSEKPYAHLMIKKKPNSDDDLADAIKELKIQTHFQAGGPVLSFLDADAYTIRKGWGHYEHCIAIETELYDGDLNALEGTFNDDKIFLEIFIAMSKAVKKFHEENYLHRDIKPDNFFYRIVNGKIEVVLGDFGLSQSRKDSEFGQHLCGTIGFLDPGTCLTTVEKRRAFSTFRYGKRADIFSLGISFLVMLYGRDHELYDQSLAVNRVFRKYERTVLEAKMQKAVKKFKTLHQAHFPQGNHGLHFGKSLRFKIHEIIGKMLHVDPKSRIKMDEVIAAFTALQEEYVLKH